MSNTFINIDYAKVEEKVIQLLKDKPNDIHSELAKQIFGSNFTQDQRQEAKSINYLKMYAQTEIK